MEYFDFVLTWGEAEELGGTAEMERMCMRNAHVCVWWSFVSDKHTLQEARPSSVRSASPCPYRIYYMI